MGGATAYQLAARSESLKIGRVALLAPGLLVAPEQYAMTLAVERAARSPTAYNYRTEAEAVEMLRLVGRRGAPREARADHGVGKAGALPARLLVADVARLHRRRRIRRGGAGDRREARAPRRRRRAAARRGTPVLVVQGGEERVIHDEVPAWVAEAVGGACEVRMLDGQGHRGCPADATRNFLTEAAWEVAGWLAKS